MEMKKGQVESTLAIVVIACIIGVILIIAGWAWLNAMNKKTDLETCKLSVLGKSYSKPGGKSPLELNCPRTSISFYNNQVISRVKDKETTKKVITKGARTDKFSNLTDDIFFQVVSEELRNCWYKMGEGKLNPFDSKLLLTYNICLVCSSIAFNQVQAKTFTGLQEYMNETAMPQSDMTYGDYLSYTDTKSGIKMPITVSIGRKGIDTEDTIYFADHVNNQYYIGWPYKFNTNTTYYAVYAAWSTSLIAGSDPLNGILAIVPADYMPAISCQMLYN
jgi:hypothetical protein